MKATGMTQEDITAVAGCVGTTDEDSSLELLEGAGLEHGALMPVPAGRGGTFTTLRQSVK